MLNTIYTINVGKVSEILNHLVSCDITFTPPLSQRVELSAYTLKLAQNATNFEAWNGQKQLIGLISVYMNDMSLKVAYITNVSVCQEYMGKGIAKKLMFECIKESKHKGFDQLQLEVNRISTPAITLYKSYGFQISEINNEIIKMNLKLKPDVKD